ncbi:hypothetical protein FSARC_12005 [Fusarium sarcochroum]|uniref:Cyclochlorotine biosynthesis protein O n=1 Tax=Fusarium sarcochroum TaxID=1208366 RepID=A0A8H4WYS5_9HYPO|nr:hypothetical protein FSARC_12005 [Fusarium sarcochroum]
MESKYRPVPNDEEQQTFEKRSLLSPSKRYPDIPLLITHYSTHPYLAWAIIDRLLTSTAPAESVANFQTVRYNITPSLELTDFVGYGPEVDKAWNHITYDVGDQMISRIELDRLGLDATSLTVKDPKTGHVGYRVGIQVFHQLHCLNLLRQETYKEYYSHMGGDIDVEPEDLRGHLNHCIEMLRTALMCQSDTGVFAFKYYEGFDGHWPDFSTLHTCRNFNAIREWAFQHAVAFGDEE